MMNLRIDVVPMKNILALVALSGLTLAGCFQRADEADEVTGSTEQAATATSNRFPYAVFSVFDVDPNHLSQGFVRPNGNSARVVDPKTQLMLSSPYNARAAGVQSKLLAMSSRLVKGACVDAKQSPVLCFQTPTKKPFTAAGSSSSYAARAKSIPRGAHPTSQEVPIFRENATGRLWAFTIHHLASSSGSSSSDFASAAGNSLRGWYCQASGKNNDLTISADAFAFYPGAEVASAGLGDTFGSTGDACLDTGDWLENAATGEWEMVGVTALEY